MVRIFTHEELTRPYVFEVGNFAGEVGMVRDTLQEMHKGHIIDGAFIYGSAIFGDTQPGSDIDLLVVTEKSSLDLLDGFHDLSNKIYDRTLITLDASVFTPGNLLEGKHHYRENVVAWLREQVEYFPENIIGNNPVDLLRPLGTELIGDVNLFFDQQRHNLQKRYMNGFGPNLEQLLEMALNIPHRAGRKAICVLQFLGHLPNSTIPDMRKSTISSVVKTVFGGSDHRLNSLYEELTLDFELYSQLCLEVRRGNISSEEYDQLLRETITTDVPKAFELLDRIQNAFLQSASMRSV